MEGTCRCRRVEAHRDCLLMFGGPNAAVDRNQHILLLFRVADLVILRRAALGGQPDED